MLKQFQDTTDNMQHVYDLHGKPAVGRFRGELTGIENAWERIDPDVWIKVLKRDVSDTTELISLARHLSTHFKDL